MNHKFTLRKGYIFLYSCLLLLIVLTGCGTDESETDWDPPLMVMVNGTVYTYHDTSNGKYRIDEDQILGYITSVVDGRPVQEGEASFPAAMGAAYGRFANEAYPNAIVVLWNNQWSLFVP